MRSSIVGKSTSNAEVTNISAHGIWLLVKQIEYFLPYDIFPGFKDAKVADILNVKFEHSEYLFWPSLGVDLEIESIENPETYPLRYK